MRILYSLFITAIIGLFCSLNLNAQTVTKRADNSIFRWGINYGMAWQSSDIRDRAGWGIGSTIEVPVIENDHSTFGASLRARYLFAETYGRDLKATTGFINNSALNGAYNPSIDYRSQGSIYQNYYTNIHDLDGELMITLNRLRAKTGILIYAFGGLGANSYRAWTDQQDFSSSMYNYSTIDPNGGTSVKEQLNLLRDNEYESQADGSRFTRHWAFAPSLGLGYGVRLGRDVYIGVEYKVTFPKTDLLDGNRWNNDNTASSNRDYWHYANGFIRIGFGGGGGGHVHTTSNNTYTPQEAKPVIDIKSPAVSPSSSCTASITAKIYNISSSSQVTVYYAGLVLAPNTWSFDASNGSFTLYDRPLVPGQTEFIIEASNSAGKRRAYVTFNCTTTIVTTPPVTNPPTVTIIEPATSPTILTDCNSGIIRATITNVTTYDIAVRKDGVLMPTSAYTYDVNSKILTLRTVTTINGNTFVIQATNTAGTASATVKLSCIDAMPTNPAPIVSITSPSANPYNSPTCNETVTATVRNVSSKNDIRVSVNNVPLASQFFQFDPITGILSFNVQTRPVADILITATNSAGMASDYTTINCAVQNTVPVVLPPTVNITNPSISPYTIQNCNVTVIAATQNVTDKSNITIRANNVAVPATNYTFDPASGLITYTTLNSGTQRYVISVYNSAGSAMDTTTITCRPYVPAPIVEITKPNTEQYTSRTCNENLIGRLVNVPRKAMITVRVNNQPLAQQQFNYDEATGILTMAVNVNNRAMVSITATTEGGSAGDFINIFCEPPHPPTVSIFTPATRPAVSTTCNEVIKARTSYINNKSGIVITVNGNQLTPAQYSFDSTRSEITLQTPIIASTLVSITVTNESGSASDNLIVTCQAPALPPGPVVQITKPAGLTYTSTTCTETILATVLNVKGAPSIQVLVNRRPITNFSYDATTKQVSFTNTIQGTSHIVVIGTNSQGTAADSVDITCAPPRPAPTVNITTPATNPYASVTCDERVVAHATNVTAQGVTVLVNGQPLANTQYSFNASTGNIAFNVSINTSSKVVVIAQNDGGIARDSVTLNCQPPAPTVTITNPSGTQFTSRSCNETITARLTNVSAKSMITVSVNNLALAPEQFNYDEATGSLTVTVRIQGRTNLTITATNRGGTASDAITLLCDPINPPTVNIFSPASRPAVSTSCTETIQARTANIRNKNGIRITVNGRALTADQFRFDSTTATISFNSAIVASTTVNITVTNEAGSASDEIVIACQPVTVQPPPVVQITRPTGNPYSSPTCNETINATVLNVAAQENIQVLVNNRPVTNFTYDATNRKVTYNNVAQGTSRIVVVATNSQGAARDSVDIICSPPRPRPTVNITMPATTPFVSTDCNERVVASTTNANQVTVSINGQPLPAAQYTYNASTGGIDFNISIADQSKVVITAQNESGIAKDSVTLRCQPPVPTVTITTPATTPYTSVSCSEKIVAQLVNVPNKSMIVVKTNDQTLTPDQYTYNETSGVLAVNISLTGNTVVTITATTRGGTASDAVTLRCTPVLPPVVTITSPATRPTVSTTCHETVTARTQNITRKSQISININGRVLAATEYAFDTTSFQINFNTTITGTSTITIVVTNSAGSSTDQVVIACQPAPAPVVQISTPATTPYTSSTCNENIEATVLNVQSQSNIRVTVNNRAITTFAYDAASKKVRFNNTTTTAGTSHVVITATNDQGSAADSVDIVCSPPRPRPTVVISTPASDPFVSVDCHENVVARVTNISNAQDVSVLVNGQYLPQTQYTLNLSTGAVNFNLTISDLSKVVIVAQNETGMAKDSVTLKCQPPAPVVNITSPATTPYTSVSCNERITAQLRNVESADQISVRKDGVLLTNSQYTFTSATGILQLQSSFNGRSTISIRATTRGGTAADSVTLVCAPPRPTVNITTPATNPYTSADCSESITARVTQVERKEQINVRQDGVILSPASWNFNAAAGTITFNTTFQNRVLVQIEAITLGGTAKDSVLITCNPRPPAPVVNITSPATNPYTSVNCKEEVAASIQNVSDRSQITVTRNGASLAADTWTFSAQAGTLILNATPTGRSTYIIKATTEGGSDADTLVLICPEVTPRPVVHITNPATNPYNSVQCQERVTARVNNVRAKSEISIRLNGQALTADQFTFNGTDLVEANVSVPSTVQFVIRVANAGGQDSDSIQLRCIPPAPVVTITSPTVNPFISTTCREQVTATVTNVDNKNFISVYINNVQISRELFEYNPTTHLVTLLIAVEAETTVKIVATNQGGTASDETHLQCRLPSSTPEVTISEDCNQSNASRSFTCTEGCTYSYSGSFNTPLTVEAGQMICITGSFAGPLVMNGGMLSVCGAINPSSIAFNGGTIIVTGSATFNHLVMNDPNSGILVYGSLAINDGHVRGRIENFGSFSFQGQLELNAGGIFKNYGELTINEDVINNSVICNKGTLRINGKLINSGAGSLYNYCKIYVSSDLKNNGTFENYGSISVSANTDLITGRVILGPGSKIITQNLQVNSDITGDAMRCSAIYINGTTRLNASANFSGKVDICDKDSIEVNNARGNFTTNCDCTVQPPSSCNITVNQDDYARVTICHKPPGNPENSHTLKVGRSAVQAHLNHGDSMGECTNEGNGNANNGNGGNGNGNGQRDQNESTTPKENKGPFDGQTSPNNGNGNESSPEINPPNLEIPKINLPKESPLPKK